MSTPINPYAMQGMTPQELSAAMAHNLAAQPEPLRDAKGRTASAYTLDPKYDPQQRPALIERMAAAAWNYKGKPTWAEIPEAWKPYYREAMARALEEVEGRK